MTEGLPVHYDLKKVIENLHDAVIVHDRNGNIIDVNNLLLEMFNIEREAAVNHTIWDFFSHEHEGNEIERMWDRAITEKIPVFEWRARNPVSGGLSHVEIDLREIIHDGTPLVVGTIRDITCRKKIENEIKESENKFKSLFENSGMPQLLIDGNRFIDCNRKALIMLGYNHKGDVVGLSPENLSVERQPDGMLSSEKSDMLLAKARREGPLEFEWVHRKADGEMLYCIVELTPIANRGIAILHTAWIDITARKRAEMALDESEKKYRSIFDATNDAILLVAEKSLIDCNQRMLTMFGFDDKEDFMRRNLDDLSPLMQPGGIESKKLSAQYIQEAYRAGSCRFEWIHRRLNGVLFPAEILLSSFELRGIKALHATIRDITERIRMNDVLRQSESRFRTIFYSVNESIVIRDINSGKIVDANKKALDLFGFDSIEELNEKYVWLDEPYSFKDVRDLMRKTLVEGRQNFEWLIRNSQGKLYWVEGRMDLINLDNVNYIIAMLYNITKRKLAEELLKRNEEKYRRITESSLDVLIMTDTERYITFVSVSITRYTKFMPVELVGKRLDDLIPNTEVPKITGKIHDAMNGTSVGLFETTIFRKDGTLAVMEVSLVPVAGNAGEKEIEFYARDISDRIQLEQKLIKITELERQRIGQDLHDGLGQTLTGVSIMIGTLARKVQLKKAVRYSEIMLIAKRIEEAIEMTRQTARGLSPVATDKEGLVSALREMSSTVCADYGINCTVTYEEYQSELDKHTATQLYYITREAVNNAIRHSNVKKITIDLKMNKKRLSLVVRNDGGIKQKNGAASDGIGMMIMSYRAKMIGASFSACRTDDGHQVELEIDFPPAVGGSG